MSATSSSRLEPPTGGPLRSPSPFAACWAPRTDPRWRIRRGRLRRRGKVMHDDAIGASDPFALVRLERGDAGLRAPGESDQRKHTCCDRCDTVTSHEHLLTFEQIRRFTWMVSGFIGRPWRKIGAEGGRTEQERPFPPVFAGLYQFAPCPNGKHSAAGGPRHIETNPRDIAEPARAEGYTSFAMSTDAGSALERLVTELSTRFTGLPIERIGEEIQRGLRLLVELLGTDRSTLSEFSPDGGPRPPRLVGSARASSSRRLCWRSCPGTTHSSCAGRPSASRVS